MTTHDTADREGWEGKNTSPAGQRIEWRDLVDCAIVMRAIRGDILDLALDLSARARVLSRNT